MNGWPKVPDCLGGDENFRSVDSIAIPVPPTQTRATMIFDGVLERHPALRIGVIEQGAIWMPGWMRQMESALDAFVRHEERLQSLRSEEHTSELQSLMRISYAVFCLKKKKRIQLQVHQQVNTTIYTSNSKITTEQLNS